MFMHTSDTTEEEASLADLVVTGTNLLNTIEDILKSTESLKVIAGKRYDIYGTLWQIAAIVILLNPFLTILLNPFLKSCCSYSDEHCHGY